MTRNGTQIEDNEPVDQTIEEFDAVDGVTAERVSRNGLDTRHEVVKVYGTRSDQFHGLDGNTTTKERSVVLNEMPANVSHEVLVGLAALHGYTLTKE